MASWLEFDLELLLEKLSYGLHQATTQPTYKIAEFAVDSHGRDVWSIDTLHSGSGFNEYSPLKLPKVAQNKFCPVDEKKKANLYFKAERASQCSMNVILLPLLWETVLRCKLQLTLKGKKLLDIGFMTYDLRDFEIETNVTTIDQYGVQIDLFDTDGKPTHNIMIARAFDDTFYTIDLTGPQFNNFDVGKNGLPLSIKEILAPALMSGVISKAKPKFFPTTLESKPFCPLKQCLS